MLLIIFSPYFLPIEKKCTLYVFIFTLILQEFEDDYTEFKAQILDPDRCPASVLCIGFHDCSGLESMFKVSTHTHESVLYY